MISYTRGNLLDAKAEALVNTVNTVGVMGKGVALMFKEAYPENFKAYEAACKRKEVRVGRMFVTERSGLLGPKWIINFPTKEHWRNPSRIEWVVEGLQDLRRVIEELGIRSVALPPLGAGNGGLEWADVRPEIEAALTDLMDVEVAVYEPTATYQNVSKRSGVEKLTPARAIIAELVRRYWVLGMECTLLEIQKLAWFVERGLRASGHKAGLDLRFKANMYGPYAHRLTHLLDSLDGSYLHCDKRIADAGPLDVIWFDDAKREKINVYFTSPEAKGFAPALEAVTSVIDGFESPFGMELLATVDWLIHMEGAEPTLEGVKAGLRNWSAGRVAAERKLRLFDDRLLSLAIERVAPPLQRAPAAIN